MKKQYISKSEINSLLSKVRERWNVSIPKVKKMLSIELDKGILYVSEQLRIVKVKSNDDYELLPFLADKDILSLFPSIKVDMGAIKHVCNGANIMRPGIVYFSNFNANDIVVVKDEMHEQYIAVGVALIDSKDAISKDKGQIVKNMHYVSDPFWNAYKELAKM